MIGKPQARRIARSRSPLIIGAAALLLAHGASGAMAIAVHGISGAAPAAAPTASAAGTPAGVSAALERQGPFWVGQQVTLDIELSSTAFSFGNQRIDLPDIPGALVLPPDSSTRKGTQQRDGETWQTITYRLKIFPQRAGSLAIPPIPVSFTTSAGYGTAQQQHDLSTDALTLEVRLPAGADGSIPLVSSRDFSLLQRWTPDADSDSGAGAGAGSGSGAGAGTEKQVLKVGDALTREIRLRAADVPGMALPPVAVGDLPDIANYPAEPEVTDQGERGSLTGQRLERQTFVFQRSGSYSIPGTKIAWWNPDSNTLTELNIEPLAIRVVPNPALQSAEPELVDGTGAALVFVVGIALAALSTAWLARRKGKAVMERLRRWAKARGMREPALFKRLIRACEENQPRQALQLFDTWQAQAVKRSGSGQDHSKPSNSPALGPLLDQLQRVVAGYEQDWQGAPLARDLKRWRQTARKARDDEPERLPPMNPGAEDVRKTQ